MKFTGKAIVGDRVLFVLVVVIITVTTPFMYSASGQEVFHNLGGNYGLPLIKRFLFSVASIYIMFFIATKVSVSFLNKSASFIYVAMMFLLLITLFTTDTVNDSRRDLGLPLLNVSIQPAAFAKVGMVIFAAYLLARDYNSEKSRVKNVKQVLIALALMAGLTISQGLSTTIILLITILLMIFVAGVNLKLIYKPLLLVLAAPLFYLAVAEVFHLPYRVGTWGNRISGWIESFSCDTLTAGSMQTCLSKSTISDGGILGNWSGDSPLRFYLAEANSDFIFSYIVGIGGIFTGILIIITYLIFFYKGIMIAKEAKSVFPAIMALGLTFLIISQAMLNIGVAVGIFPTTGQSLPFISRGGSALLSSCISVGILLSISRLNHENKTKKK